MLPWWEYQARKKSLSERQAPLSIRAEHTRAGSPKEQGLLEKLWLPGGQWEPMRLAFSSEYMRGAIPHFSKIMFE